MAPKPTGKGPVRALTAKPTPSPVPSVSAAPSASPSGSAAASGSPSASGSVAPEKLALRDAFVEALSWYRDRAWDRARAGFEACLAIVRDDGPSTAFLARIAHFIEQPPPNDWNGVWALDHK